MNKNLLLEKYIKVAVQKALKEQEEQQRSAEKAMYMVYRFPGLKKVMEDLMSPAFGSYVSGISITAPKPTTFKVDLINGQDFSVKYLGKGLFNLKVAGKKYNPINIGELERASQAVADLLELNYAPAEGKEQAQKPAGPGEAELGADLAAANNEPPTPSANPTTAPPIAGAPIPETPPTGEEIPPEEEENPNNK
jgi:hypothetical protein